jgi:transcriptional regulator with XRE-family HTH domain
MDTAGTINAARLEARLTQTQLAKRSGTSQATISAYEHGTKSPTTPTLARILAAAGRRLTTVPAARAVVVPTSDELEWRGRTLSQVLDLAARLPTKSRGRLRFPRLHAARGGGS